ncbi:MAG: GNAT family N-acetyltransferase [Deltaproteobacteria bacterium]|nr:GNAT family N-acetyltransferase [Deltaproteobacteria bacterium]
MEWHRDDFAISDDRSRVDIDVVSNLLARSYWRHRRSREVVEKLIQNSLCFSLFRNDEQIGFGRVVTDFTVFSWLSDLVITEAYRGMGLGKWLITCIVNHPGIAETQFVLQTGSAYGLYDKFEFRLSEKLMTREPYGAKNREIDS